MIDIDELYYDAEELLLRMIATPSVSRNEDNVAQLLQDQMTAWGLPCQRLGCNVWTVAPGFNASLPTLLLNSHIDTVKPAQGWQTDPYKPTRGDDNRIIGLGSNDAGASVVALLAAFRSLSQHQQPYNLIFLASCEEEVSGKQGIESVLPLLPPISVAIVGEPTAMQPAIAEKGLMVLDAEATGRAGHAARNEGINAIYQAIDAINALRNLNFPRQSELLGPIKVSTTVINAGTQHNVVPDVCQFVVDVRTTDAHTNLETLEIIRQAAPWCTFTPRSTRLNPSGISQQHPLVKRLITLGKQPFGSPTLSDQALMPFPSLKMGPGDSARSHTANEYIHPMELREAIHTYITLLHGATI
ncbi:MAG: M20 family metallo-hydrolase [Muribaculaceae bacterium]